MPSLEGNAKYDYLPPPSVTETVSFPPDDIWPANPPRVDLFCEGSALCHPLVSPLAAMDWKNAPPVFITCGEEMLADENYVLARRLADQGVKVVWEQYEAMPHCFAMMLEGHAGANMCMEKWGEVIKDMVEKPEEVKTVGTWVTAKKLQRKDVDIKTLIEISDEDVLKRMKESRDKRVEAFEKGLESTPAEPKL
jgi:acetyl esterase/lipase